MRAVAFVALLGLAGCPVIYCGAQTAVDAGPRDEDAGETCGDAGTAQPREICQQGQLGTCTRLCIGSTCVIAAEDFGNQYEGFCVAPGTSDVAQGCNTDVECRAGLFCSTGRCVGCDAQHGCDAGSSCEADCASFGSSNVPGTICVALAAAGEGCAAACHDFTTPPDTTRSCGLGLSCTGACDAGPCCQ